MINAYNTLTRTKEPLPRAARGKKLRLFVCGPTVYDYSHIGHGRTYTSFDAIVRWIEKRGIPVEYLMNITDIDDKIISRAQREDTTWKKLTGFFEREFMHDLGRLAVREVDAFLRASDHIPEIISQIKLLIKRGVAYKTQTGVYFSVKKFPDYGKLAHRKLNEMKEAVRIDPDPTKHNPADFTLWKLQKPGEPWWNSPWGKGRPGWHIEDTAIAKKYFGPQYELHGGALDLIFPHHESEIAQMEAAYGKKPFVKLWMHSGFLNVRGGKMAKSLGNFVTIHEILETWDPRILRFMYLRAHYRAPLDYDDDLLADAAAAWDRIKDFVERLGNYKRQTINDRRQNEVIKTFIITARKKFETAMDDDFNTPVALVVVFDLITQVNPLLEGGTVSVKNRTLLFKFLKEVDDIFGILPPLQKTAVPPDVMRLVWARETFRKEGKFAEGDRIRKELLAEGWTVEDTASGPRINRKSSTPVSK